MRDALERTGFAREHFTAPNGPVGAVAGAVETHPDQRFAVPVFGRKCRTVRPVVLHPNERQPAVSSKRFRPVRREVIRVRVARDRFRFDAEQPRQVLDRTLECCQCRGAAHVANVLTQERPLTHRETEHGLQLTADREHRRAAVTK
jgi:hypothetical protein